MAPHVEIPVHSPDDLQAIYRERFAGQAAYRQQVWQVLCRYFARWVRADGTVLDLGCGHCEFINNIPARRKYGMDLNPDSRATAASGVSILQQDCSTTWAVTPGSIDTVFSSNFLEHLPDKAALLRTLAHARLALRPGGTIVLMGPNIKYLPGAYWDFFDHYVTLTELSLAEALVTSGYEVEQCTARFLPYSMSQGRTYPTWMLERYLKMPWVWPLFGKQFLLVAHAR